MTRFVLIVSGLGFIAFGLMGLIDPIGLWESFKLPVADVPAIRTELRAFYGGLELAVGGLLLAHLGPASRERSGLIIAAVLYFGVALGRLTGIVVDGEVAQAHWIALTVELVLGALSVLALKRQRGTASP